MLRKTLPSEMRICGTFLATKDIRTTAAALSIKPATAAKTIYTLLVQTGKVALEDVAPADIVRECFAFLEGDSAMGGLPALLGRFPDREPWLLRMVYYEYVHRWKDANGRRAAEMLKEGLGIEETASRMGVAAGTVYGWLGRLVAAGEADAALAVPPSQEEAVRAFLRDNGRKPYKEMYEALGGEVPYGAIRLVDLQWYRDNDLSES